MAVAYPSLASPFVLPNMQGPASSYLLFGGILRSPFFQVMSGFGDA